MAIDRDDNEERLTRVEHIVEHLQRQQHELQRAVGESRAARERSIDSQPADPKKDDKTRD